MFDEYLHIGSDGYARVSTRVSENIGQHRLYALGWKNCPAAWKGVYTTGFKAGSNNDINVLQSSPLFNDQCLGVGLTASFITNGNQHNMGYYFADGIYPMWLVFAKTIKCETEEKKIDFASRQEAARKDVERAFGVLQARWAAVKGPSWLWCIDCVG
ncbi:uncharacterized protein LOC125220216 [Salvia hispanica]|uniref:uncharacterized protein LOC125220216 n=1 Tax=Salvia hispanica TaxID=49212 RepID=UPI0020094154|nr:uncharacterized protein LOC125220216 [Salvia hispanica]